MSSSEPRRRYGDYALGRQIGIGNLGVVYEATQISLSRTVALKRILNASPEARRRFDIEAEAIAKLDHPHIVPIYDIGEHEHEPFISMKLVEGESLHKKLAVGELCLVPRDSEQSSAQFLDRSTPMAKFIACVARALDYAHKQGVLHENLKPANILVDREDQPHLIDFGLAMFLDEPVGHHWHWIPSRDVLSAPDYMSPEQVAGHRPTYASDIFSLGVIFYEMLTGHRPFKAATPFQITRLIVEQPPIRPHLLNRHVDKNLEAICLKCLEKNPNARYASAEDVALDLENWLANRPLMLPRASPILRTARWARHNRVAAILILILLLGMLTALVQLTIFWEHRKRLESIRASDNNEIIKQIESLRHNPGEHRLDVKSSSLASLACLPPKINTLDPVTLSFGINTTDDPGSSATRYAPFLRLLEDKVEAILHRPLIFDLRLYEPEHPALLQDTVTKETDLIRLSPLAYLRANKTNAGLEALAWLIPDQEAVIFTRHGSGITNLDQVAGKRLILAHTNCLYNFQAKVLLAQAGLCSTNLKDFENVPVPSSSTFFVADFIDLPLLAGKLKQSIDPVSIYLRGQFFLAIRDVLENYQDSRSDQVPLQLALVEVFNRIIRGRSLYDAQRFTGVTLRSETQQLLAQNPQGDALLCLNRLLLEDAYPQELSRNPISFYGTNSFFVTSYDCDAYAHQLVISNVLSGKFDVGEAPLRHFSRHQYSDKQQILVLTNFFVPQDLLVARPGLSPDIIAALRQALGSIGVKTGLRSVFQARKETKILKEALQTDPNAFSVQRLLPITDCSLDYMRGYLTNELAWFETGKPPPHRR